VGLLEAGESLGQRIAQRPSEVGLFDQYLNWPVCGVYKVQLRNRMRQGPVDHWYCASAKWKEKAEAVVFNRFGSKKTSDMSCMGRYQ
jgi:hypothetical protein